jgi:heme-degrading monooxygenase HmoA
MLLERAEVLINEGSEAGFAACMAARGTALLASVPGVISVQQGQGVESPSKFLLLIHWESLEAHTEFNKSPAFAEFMKLIEPYFAGGGMEHFQMG